jgi:hypothetical protein
MPLRRSYLAQFSEQILLVLGKSGWEDNSYPCQQISAILRADPEWPALALQAEDASVLCLGGN